MIREFQGEYRFLSNFYPAEIEYNGILYPTVEHAYQAAKTMSSSTKVFISMLKKPGDAKKMGQRVKVRPNWEELKLPVMEQLLIKKFEIPELREKLLATGNLLLQEGNWWGDTFWGYCLKTNRGFNHLGLLLMKVREQARQNR